MKKLIFGLDSTMFSLRDFVLLLAQRCMPQTKAGRI